MRRHAPHAPRSVEADLAALFEPVRGLRALPLCTDVRLGAPPPVAADAAPEGPGGGGAPPPPQAAVLITFHPHPHLWIVEPLQFHLAFPAAYPAQPPVATCLDAAFVATHADTAALDRATGQSLLQLLSGAPMGWQRGYTLADVINCLRQALARGPATSAAASHHRAAHSGGGGGTHHRPDGHHGHPHAHHHGRRHHQEPHGQPPPPSGCHEPQQPLSQANSRELASPPRAGATGSSLDLSVGTLSLLPHGGGSGHLSVDTSGPLVTLLDVTGQDVTCSQLPTPVAAAVLNASLSLAAAAGGGRVAAAAELRAADRALAMTVASPSTTAASSSSARWAGWDGCSAAASASPVLGPAHGVSSQQGRRVGMEDAWAAEDSLLLLARPILEEAAVGSGGTACDGGAPPSSAAPFVAADGEHSRPQRVPGPPVSSIDDQLSLWESSLLVTSAAAPSLAGASHAEHASSSLDRSVRDEGSPAAVAAATAAAAAAAPSVGVYAVMDGHGGDRAARYVSEHLVSAVRDALTAYQRRPAAATAAGDVHGGTGGCGIAGRGPASGSAVAHALHEAFLQLDASLETELARPPPPPPPSLSSGSSSGTKLRWADGLGGSDEGLAFAGPGAGGSESSSADAATSGGAGGGIGAVHAGGSKRGSRYRYNTLRRPPAPLEHAADGVGATAQGSGHLQAGGAGGSRPSCSGGEDVSGTTAVVAVVTRLTLPPSVGTPSAADAPSLGHSGPQPTALLTVAAVGDSRAVLCRGGSALLVSPPEHHPTRPDERARVLNAGGILIQGRVLGRLAVTRSLGDLGFKRGNDNVTPLVTGAPEVVETPLVPGQDEFCILACDGVWDVLTDSEAIALVRSGVKDAVAAAAAARAAASLTAAHHTHAGAPEAGAGVSAGVAAPTGALDAAPPPSCVRGSSAPATAAGPGVARSPACIRCFRPARGGASAAGSDAGTPTPGPALPPVVALPAAATLAAAAAGAADMVGPWQLQHPTSDRHACAATRDSRCDGSIDVGDGAVDEHAARSVLASELARRLTCEALDRGSADNVTALVVLLPTLTARLASVSRHYDGDDVGEGRAHVCEDCQRDVGDGTGGDGDATQGQGRGGHAPGDGGLPLASGGGAGIVSGMGSIDESSGDPQAAAATGGFSAAFPHPLPSTGGVSTAAVPVEPRQRAASLPPMLFAAMRRVDTLLATAPAAAVPSSPPLSARSARSALGALATAPADGIALSSRSRSPSAPLSARGDADAAPFDGAQQQQLPVRRAATGHVDPSQHWCIESAVDVLTSSDEDDDDGRRHGGRSAASALASAVIASPRARAASEPFTRPHAAAQAPAIPHLSLARGAPAALVHATPAPSEVAVAVSTSTVTASPRTARGIPGAFSHQRSLEDAPWPSLAPSGVGGIALTSAAQFTSPRASSYGGDGAPAPANTLAELPAPPGPRAGQHEPQQQQPQPPYLLTHRPPRAAPSFTTTLASSSSHSVPHGSSADSAPAPSSDATAVPSLAAAAPPLHASSTVVSPRRVHSLQLMASPRLSFASPTIARTLSSGYPVMEPLEQGGQHLGHDVGGAAGSSSSRVGMGGQSLAPRPPQVHAVSRTASMTRGSLDIEGATAVADGDDYVDEDDDDGRRRRNAFCGDGSSPDLRCGFGGEEEGGPQGDGDGDDDGGYAAAEHARHSAHSADASLSARGWAALSRTRPQLAFPATPSLLTNDAMLGAHAQSGVPLPHTYPPIAAPSSGGSEASASLVSPLYSTVSTTEDAGSRVATSLSPGSGVADETSPTLQPPPSALVHQTSQLLPPVARAASFSLQLSATNPGSPAAGNVLIGGDGTPLSGRLPSSSPTLGPTSAVALRSLNAIREATEVGADPTAWPSLASGESGGAGHPLSGGHRLQQHHPAAVAAVARLAAAGGVGGSGFARQSSFPLVAGGGRALMAGQPHVGASPVGYVAGGIAAPPPTAAPPSATVAPYAPGPDELVAPSGSMSPLPPPLHGAASSASYYPVPPPHAHGGVSEATDAAVGGGHARVPSSFAVSATGSAGHMPMMSTARSAALCAGNSSYGSGSATPTTASSGAAGAAAATAVPQTSRALSSTPRVFSFLVSPQQQQPVQAPQPPPSTRLPLASEMRRSSSHAHSLSGSSSFLSLSALASGSASVVHNQDDLVSLGAACSSSPLDGGHSTADHQRTGLAAPHPLGVEPLSHHPGLPLPGPPLTRHASCSSDGVVHTARHASTEQPHSPLLLLAGSTLAAELVPRLQRVASSGDSVPRAARYLPYSLVAAAPAFSVAPTDGGGPVWAHSLAAGRSPIASASFSGPPAPAGGAAPGGEPPTRQLSSSSAATAPPPNLLLPSLSRVTSALSLPAVGGGHHHPVSPQQVGLNGSGGGVGNTGGGAGSSGSFTALPPLSRAPSGRSLGPLPVQQQQQQQPACGGVGGAAAGGGHGGVSPLPTHGGSSGGGTLPLATQRARLLSTASVASTTLGSLAVNLSGTSSGSKSTASSAGVVVSSSSSDSLGGSTVTPRLGLSRVSTGFESLPPDGTSTLPNSLADASSSSGGGGSMLRSLKRLSGGRSSSVNSEGGGGGGGWGGWGDTSGPVLTRTPSFAAAAPLEAAAAASAPVTGEPPHECGAAWEAPPPGAHLRVSTVAAMGAAAALLSPLQPRQQQPLPPLLHQQAAASVLSPATTVALPTPRLREA